MTAAGPPAALDARPRLLVLDPWQEEHVTESLRQRFDVRTTSTLVQAVDLASTTLLDAVVTELRLPDGDGVDLCRLVRTLPDRPAVLVTTDAVEAVPAALAVACDGVLVKPYPVSLLHNRLCLLLKRRGQQIQQSAAVQRRKIAHLKRRLGDLQSGTNRVWLDTQCPGCGTGAAVSFDSASHRREWFACLACQKVWLARRPD